MSAPGTAGRRGEQVRSDLFVSVAPGGSGIRLEVVSRVEAYYGNSIREQVRATLAGLGVAHASVTVEDQGALPFVITARVEAAALRAGAARTAAPPVGPARAGSARDRLRRSRLYLPGNEPKYFINAALHGPDGVILDLEDSVHPDEKDAARRLVAHALSSVDFLRSERMVRINQAPAGLADLEAVLPARPDVILIPKVESEEHVRAIDAAIARILGAGPAAPPWLLPILESALGIERAFEIARSSPRIIGLTLGLEDYAADLGVARSPEGDESLYARLRVVNAARAAGLQAIDSVYGQVDDLAGLAAWGQASRRRGFCGMGCLHPRQIEVIHRCYDPSPAEIERALRIVEAFRAAEAAGLGVVSLGSRMIDAPVVRQALSVVGQARELGLLPREADAEAL